MITRLSGNFDQRFQEFILVPPTELSFSLVPSTLVDRDLP